MKTTKHKIEVMQAFEDFKPIEIELQEGRWAEWCPDSEPNWNWEKNNYRVKPSTKLRPWAPEEVPVGALIRHKDYKIGRTVILYVCGDLIKDATPAGEGSSEYTAERALNLFEHSTDCGKTWLPCGVLEVSK